MSSSVLKKVLIATGLALSILWYTNPTAAQCEAAIAKDLKDAIYSKNERGLVSRLVGFGTKVFAAAIPFQYYNYFFFSLAIFGEEGFGLGILGAFFFFEASRKQIKLLK